MLRFELSYGSKPRYLYYTINGRIDISSYYAWTKANFIIKGDGTSETPYVFKLTSKGRMLLTKITISDSDSYTKIIDSDYHTISIRKCSNICLADSKFLYVGLLQSTNITFTNLRVTRKVILWSCDNTNLVDSNIRKCNLIGGNNKLSISHCQIKILNRIQEEDEPQYNDSQIDKVKVKRSFDLSNYP